MPGGRGESLRCKEKTHEIPILEEERRKGKREKEREREGGREAGTELTNEIKFE